MNEDALRALIRDVIARAAARGASAESGLGDAPQLLQMSQHPSSYQYALPPSDGPCLIEPGVACNHCGYCQTHGH